MNAPGLAGAPLPDGVELLCSSCALELAERAPAPRAAGTSWARRLLTYSPYSSYELDEIERAVYARDGAQ